MKATLVPSVGLRHKHPPADLPSVELSDASIRWLIGHIVWLPVLFFAIITPILALFSTKPAARLRRDAHFVVVLAGCTLLFSYISPDSRHALMAYLFLVVVVLGAVRYYRSTPIQRQFGSLAPIVAAHRSGDYESALRLCDGSALQRVPETMAILLRGSALYYLRRLDEAESLLRAALTKRPSRTTESLILDQLGQVLLEKGQRNEAVRSFQRSEELDPDRGGAFQSEAEVYLRGGYQLQKALELARHAVDLDRKQPAEKRAVSLCTSLAALAWALAANGHAAEARESAQDALVQTPTDSVPLMAENHYLAARAMLALGDQSTASQYFGKVAELDAKGNFGFLARQELASLA